MRITYEIPLSLIGSYIFIFTVYLLIWQNWCFAQFHQLRIVILPNCSALFCVSLFCERWLERIERKFETQNRAIVRGVGFSMIHSMMKWYHKAPLFFWGKKSVNIYLSKDILLKKIPKSVTLLPFRILLSIAIMEWRIKQNRKTIWNCILSLSNPKFIWLQIMTNSKLRSMT